MHPIPVTVHHDLLDYVAVIGGAVGGVAALIALWLAWLSKKGAERSAVAAEQTKALADEQVAIMRREAGAALEERSRRAAPTIEIGASPIAGSGPAQLVILTVGFGNDAGTRAVERLAVNVRVPDSIQLRTCKDQFGNGAGGDGISLMESVQLGEHMGALVWQANVGPIERLAHPYQYLALGLPPSGEHRIEATIIHPDLPGGAYSAAWILKVPANAGEELELTRVEG
jgi:hypothetical protein